MPTPTSQQALTRLKIQSIVREFSDLASDRVQLGQTDLNADSEFFLDMPTAGPYYLILPAFNRNRNIQNRTYELVVQCKLYFGIPGDQNYDSLAIEDVWSLIEDAVVDSENYIGVNWTGAPAPMDGNTAWAGFIDKQEYKPNIGLYLQEFVFAGTSDYR